MDFRFIFEYEKPIVNEFLKKLDLVLEEDVEETLICYEKDEILGTCSYSQNIIKCFGIKKEHQGEGLASSLITKIQNRMFDKGIYEYFVFTLDKNVAIFESLGYKKVASSEGVTLLEGGMASIYKYLENMLIKSGLDKNRKRAALVVNCNPFTLGHQYLIETAAKENDDVVVFVVEEDRSAFPTDIRFNLVKEGCKHLNNVTVLKGGRYIISSNTFPAYFLRKKDDKLSIYTKLDATIFGMYISKVFNIEKRYVGTEPYCEVTNEYNNSLKEILPKYSVEVHLIERLVKDGIKISASMVRSLLKEGRIEEVKNLVPKTTYDFLMTQEGKEIIEKIKRRDLPH